MFRRALAVALATGALFFVFASDAGAGAGKHAAFILDANTGAVLHEEQADESRHPASLTKMMTLYLTFETIESGRLKPSDKITISEAAASVAPSKLDLDPGEQISVSDAIRAVITKSANDIAVALAEKIGGSEANFVRLMNARARAIGMARTHYVNASGLPDDDQVTTARDMSTLALHLQDDYPTYFPLFATRVFTYEGKSYRNHNTMLNTFAGVEGIKTGYTRASGFNLVTSVRRGDRHLVGVVFGGETAGVRNAEMRVLLTRALTRASTRQTRKPVPMLVAGLKSPPKTVQRPVRQPKPAVEVASAPVAPTVRPFAPAKAALPAVTVEPDPALVAMQNASPPLSQPQAPPQDEAPDAPLQIFKVKHVAVSDKPRSPDETTDMEDTEKPAASALPPPRGMPGRTDLGRFATAQADQAIAPDDGIGRLAAMSIGDDHAETAIMKLAGPAAPLSQLPPPADAAAAPKSDGPLHPAAFTPSATPAVLPTITLSAPETPAEAAEPAAEPTDPAPAAIVRGSPPSTLTAQAKVLGASKNARQVVASLKGGRYEVQIGAYASMDEAQRALVSVQGRNTKLLSGVASVTQPAIKDGKQVFRARFAGFNADRASSTCNQLRRQAVDCFVMAAQ